MHVLKTIPELFKYWTDIEISRQGNLKERFTIPIVFQLIRDYYHEKQSHNLHLYLLFGMVSSSVVKSENITELWVVVVRFSVGEIKQNKNKINKKILTSKLKKILFLL